MRLFYNILKHLKRAGLKPQQSPLSQGPVTPLSTSGYESAYGNWDVAEPDWTCFPLRLQTSVGYGGYSSPSPSLSSHGIGDIPCLVATKVLAI
jgi:hypothetical protein